MSVQRKFASDVVEGDVVYYEGEWGKVLATAEDRRVEGQERVVLAFRYGDGSVVLVERHLDAEIPVEVKE